MVHIFATLRLTCLLVLRLRFRLMLGILVTNICPPYVTSPIFQKSFLRTDRQHIYFVGLTSTEELKLIFFFASSKDLRSSSTFDEKLNMSGIS